MAIKSSWGQSINTSAFGKVYQTTEFSEYIFTELVGDFNAYYKRVNDDSGTLENEAASFDNLFNILT